MSCRIIGRNIEYAFIDYVIEKIKKENITNLKATFIKPRKNEQVKEFYDRCSFSLIESNDSVRNYTLDINKYMQKQIKYIEVINGK